MRFGASAAGPRESDECGEGSTHESTMLTKSATTKVSSVKRMLQLSKPLEDIDALFVVTFVCRVQPRKLPALLSGQGFHRQHLRLFMNVH